LGRYDLHEEIGRGGMGVVLRGHDPDLGRDLAVKVLLANHQNDPAVVSRFTEEAQIGGQLQHPGIVPVYEVGRADDQRPYFTMKLVQGRTLATLLHERSNPRQNRSRFEQIFEQVCQTMAYAHSRGVIHRDLKPANVMVGAFGEVQVMDWGLAKVLSREGGPSPPPPWCVAKHPSGNAPGVVRTARSAGLGPASLPGHAMGTPAYMAPEQAAGEVDRLDERCDVFGLGGILCEILTGQPPYRGEAGEVFTKALRADLEETFARLDACGADPELIRLARDSLAAQVADRPRDAGVLAAGMAAYRESIETRLRQAELTQAETRARAAEVGKRRRLKVGLAAWVLVTVLGAGGAWLWIARARAAAERQERALQEKHALEAEEALALANKLSSQSRAEGPGSICAEARAQAKRAEALLERLPDQPALRERVHAVLQKLDDVEADRQLLARVEEIRLTKTSLRPHDMVLVSRGATPEYEKALRAYGVAVGAPPRQVGARLRQRGPVVRSRVVAALDDWLVLLPREGRQAKWLAAVLAEADPDPWRQRLRRARRNRDRAELERLAGQVSTAGQPPQTLLMLGEGLNHCGTRARAQAVLRRAQEQYPGDTWINLFLGWHLAQAPGQSDDALRFLTAAAALHPDSPTVLSLVGVLLGKKGDVDGALAVFRRAATLKPELTEVHANLGNALYLKGDLDGAVAAYSRALALAPQSFSPTAMLGHILSRKGDRDGAMASWRRALALEGDAGHHHRIAHELGRAHAARGRWAAAAEAYAHAWKCALTDDGHFWFEYAAVLLLAGDRPAYRDACAHMARRYGKARQHLRAYHVARACTLAPDAAQDAARPEAVPGTAENEAMRLADEELKASDRAPWSLTQQAALHYRAGRFAQAIPLLEQSLRADRGPGAGVLNWLWLALAKQRLGQPEEARRRLAQATKCLALFRDGLPAGAGPELKLDLHNWLEAHILRREGEARLAGRPAVGKP
jgi:serine/threonine-protein kinase